MEGYAEGFRSVLKPVLSPTYMQNIRPLKIAYTVNLSQGRHFRFLLLSKLLKSFKPTDNQSLSIKNQLKP